MEGRIKFRVDLEAFKYDDIENRDTVVLKDPVSGKYFYLSVYEYRLLQSLDGNLTLEDAIERLARAGYHYSIEDAGAIVGKAAQLGLVLGTKFSTAQFQQHVKRQMEKAKKSRRAANIYFLFIPLLNPDRFLERTLWIVKLIANKLALGLLALALPGAIYCIVSGFDGESLYGEGEPILDPDAALVCQMEPVRPVFSVIDCNRLPRGARDRRGMSRCLLSLVSYSGPWWDRHTKLSQNSGSTKIVARFGVVNVKSPHPNPLPEGEGADQEGRIVLSPSGRGTE